MTRHLAVRLLGVVLLAGLGVGGWFVVQYLLAPSENGTQPPIVGPVPERQAIPVPPVRFTNCSWLMPNGSASPSVVHCRPSRFRP